MNPRYLILASFFAISLSAQNAPNPGRGANQTAKTMAPADFTGYWAAVVVEDWRYRMLPATKLEAKPTLGQRIDVPMTPEARQIALNWDPAKDEAAGAACKAYGAANIMRIPERIHITWQDDNILKLETDAGQQTRLFGFRGAQGESGSWQGMSEASWETTPGGRGGPIATGSLRIFTDRLKPGYLMKNGIPYSAKATVTEYFDRVDEKDASYLVVTTTVDDPTYLTQPYLTSVHFKRQADNSGWSPTPCSAR